MPVPVKQMEESARTKDEGTDIQVVGAARGGQIQVCLEQSGSGKGLLS